MRPRDTFGEIRTALEEYRRNPSERGIRRDFLGGGEIELALRAILSLKEDHDRLVNRMNCDMRPSEESEPLVVSRAQMEEAVRRLGGYYTIATADIYHSDPGCVWGNRIAPRFFREGRGRNRRLCGLCKSRS